MKTTPLSLDVIKTNAGTQSRLTINSYTVDDYAEVISAVPLTEWPFPPLDVFFNGTDYLLSSGFHRYFGAEKAKRSSVPCVIHEGDVKDAIIFGMKSNDKNGLRRSPEDKRANVEWILDNCGKLPQKDIAEMAGVGLTLVKKIVAERNTDSIRGKASPPKQDSEGHGDPDTTNRGGSNGKCDVEDDVVPLRPKKGNKPEPKEIKQKTPHESEVWQAQQVMKTWTDAVGRWMSCHPSIDGYRNKFPGLAGDRVINAAKELWTALDAWKKVIR